MTEPNYVGCDVTELTTPFFLVDIDRVKNNAEKMTERCRNLGVKLRPHMKTHKTLEAGELMTNGTKRRIAVSTLQEAEFFADGGFEDIMLSVITTADKLQRCTELAKRLEAFHLFVDSNYGLNMLENSPLGGGKKWSVVLKVDCGYGRAGVLWDSEASVALGKAISTSKNLSLFALYSHCGNSYKTQSPEELRHVQEIHATRLVHLRERLKAVGVAEMEISCGSTPSCSHPADKFSSLTELHPGNYIFNDWMQVCVGSCSADDIGVRVASRIIGHYPEKHHMLIDAGFTALGSGGLAVETSAPTGFTFIQDNPDLKITGMTQEVGYVKAVSGEIDYSKYPIGSLLFIYPFHSCETACLYPRYYVHSGTKVKAVWEPTRGW